MRSTFERFSIWGPGLIGGAPCDKKIAFRNVKVGPRVDTLWIIESGLKAGEQVVAEGLQSVRDGMEVRTKPMAAPAAGEAK